MRAKQTRAIDELGDDHEEDGREENHDSQAGGKDQRCDQ
jgi:hypothetical protein